MNLIIILLGAAIWYIGHEWIGLTVLTSLSIFAAVLLTLLSITDIVSTKRARIRISKSYKCQAVVLSKQTVRGYRGRTIYLVELHPEFDKVILNKNDLPRSLQVNDIFDAYPIYDKDRNIIDFDYDADIQKRLTKPVHIAAVITILLSIFLTANDGSSFVRHMSDIVSGLLMFALLMTIGIISLRKFIISRSGRLTPINANIHNIMVVHQTRDGQDFTYINPIYRAVIEGEAYQFSGSAEITEDDKGKEVMVYYDKNTMAFFEAADLKSKSSLIIAIVMFALSIGIFYTLFK